MGLSWLASFVVGVSSVRRQRLVLAHAVAQRSSAKGADTRFVLRPYGCVGRARKVKPRTTNSIGSTVHLRASSAFAWGLLMT